MFGCKPMPISRVEVRSTRILLFPGTPNGVPIMAGVCRCRCSSDCGSAPRAETELPISPHNIKGIRTLCVDSDPVGTLILRGLAPCGDSHPMGICTLWGFAPCGDSHPAGIRTHAICNWRADASCAKFYSHTNPSLVLEGFVG